jgi:hypothetical protein
MAVATLPVVFIPKTESFRITSRLSHAGQPTGVDAVVTYFSKSPPHARQRYS